MQKLLGVSELIGKAGSVPISALAAKDYVMLYFSASWCPPCKAFTPKLVDFYTKNKENKNFEIVFVSRDNDEPSFKTYYDHHPWLAIYGAQTTDPLASQLGIKGIPAVVIVNAKTGEVVTKEGRMGVMIDADAKAFPWLPSLETTLFTDTVQGVSGPVALADVKANNDYIFLYFSASWCGPCKMFTPKLSEFYEKHKGTKKFEIIFLSLDRSEADFKTYREHHPWLAYYAPSVQAAASAMGVKGIPTLILLNAKTGEKITDDAVQEVLNDPEAASFPWPPTVRTFVGTSEVTSKTGTVQLNDLVANNDYILLYFSASWCPPCKMFTPKLSEFYTKHKEAKKFEIIFMSLDKDEASFKTYYEHHPWHAVYGDSVKEAAGKIGVSGIPCLAVIDAKSGKLITSEAVQNVMSDAEGEHFPWKE